MLDLDPLRLHPSNGADASSVGDVPFPPPGVKLVQGPGIHGFREPQCGIELTGVRCLRGLFILISQGDVDSLTRFFATNQVINRCDSL